MSQLDKDAFEVLLANVRMSLFSFPEPFSLTVCCSLWKSQT